MNKQDWLVKYEALRDRSRPSSPLRILEHTDESGAPYRVDIILFHAYTSITIACFLNGRGSDLPYNPRHNAFLFIKAWEAKKDD